MKKNTLSKGLVAAWLIATVMAFTACSSEDSTMEYIQAEASAEVVTKAAAASNPYSIVLKAFSNNKDITTKGDVDSVTLFVFDENYDYVETRTIDKATVLNRRTISIQANGTDSITVVAWAGLTNKKEEVSSLNQNSILSDLRVQLKQNNGQVTSPSDLFHGQITIGRPSATRTENVQTLAIERKVAELSLTTTGIAKKFGNTNGDFYYKIKTATSAINHDGTFAGKEVEYIVPATANKAGNLVAANIAILPSDDITIELYKNDVLVLSSKKLRNSQELSLNASELFNITFDACKYRLDLIVAAWGQTIHAVNVA
ncbi:FimB/Mfa2 family fimbrial subunit [Parabacteroides sp. PF5-6]|uniref:FimB/Mfa2 family fimbrial subunit n=2 Tax=Parabacteroides sp. PF5-6 TaxID=1742403 RepID=UPI0024059FEC|nr:FimB/Mfa2 family fimbrial subunit [Parabacteroides sp. PF5-6]MDF9829886.1 hypothetical protein [Parabacteroides sp. PF5-6]